MLIDEISESKQICWFSRLASSKCQCLEANGFGKMPGVYMYSMNQRYVEETQMMNKKPSYIAPLQLELLLENLSSGHHIQREQSLIQLRTFMVRLYKELSIRSGTKTSKAAEDALRILDAAQKSLVRYHHFESKRRLFPSDSLDHHRLEGLGKMFAISAKRLTTQAFQLSRSVLFST